MARVFLADQTLTLAPQSGVMKYVFWILFLAIVACSSQAPQPSLRILGKLELSFDTSFDTSRSAARVQNVLADDVVTFTALGTTLKDDTANNLRYLNADFSITTKAGSADISNLTLYAYHQASSNVGGTAIKSNKKSPRQASGY